MREIKSIQELYRTLRAIARRPGAGRVRYPTQGQKFRLMGQSGHIRLNVFSTEGEPDANAAAELERANRFLTDRLLPQLPEPTHYSERNVMENRPRFRISPRTGRPGHWAAQALMWRDPEEPMGDPEYCLPERTWFVADADTPQGAMAAAEFSPLASADKWGQ